MYDASCVYLGLGGQPHGVLALQHYYLHALHGFFTKLHVFVNFCKIDGFTWFI